MVGVKRFDVCLVSLNPTVGSELRKRRPCLIISPNSMNQSRLRTVIIAPMTTTIRKHFPTRVDLTFQGKRGQVALDQLRVIDRSRIVSKIGFIGPSTARKVISLLQTMFR